MTDEKHVVTASQQPGDTAAVPCQLTTPTNQPKHADCLYLCTFFCETDDMPWNCAQCSACAGCSPGYYNNSTSTKAAVCTLCPKGSWCPGGSAAAASRIRCGPFLTTVSTGAVSPASCITQPGTAYMTGMGTALACTRGSYNEGGNQRNCTGCPVGMSTAAVGASSSGACTAQPGWFYHLQVMTHVLARAAGGLKVPMQQDVCCLLAFCLLQHGTANIQHTRPLHMHACDMG